MTKQQFAVILQTYFQRQPLQFAAKKGPAKPPALPDPSTYMTYPEQQAFEEMQSGGKPLPKNPGKRDYINRARSAGKMDQFTGLVQPALDPKANPFGGVLPHVRTIESLAEFGSPARGEYENAARNVMDLFGHDEDGPWAWMGLNGVFSPNTQYLDHAGAASMITAAWLAAGKPKESHTIERLIRDVHQFGKQYQPELVNSILSTPEAIHGGHPQLRARDAKKGYSVENRIFSGLQPGETFGGTTGSGDAIKKAVHVLQNTDKLRAALEDPHTPAGLNLAMLGGKGLSKVPNFVTSYISPQFGSAIDMHMGRLAYHPDFESFLHKSDILSQVMAGIAKPGELSKFKAQSLKGYPVTSDLVKALLPYADTPIKSPTKKDPNNQITLLQWMKNVNSKLIQSPTNYLAYKTVIAQAAKNLGWTPAQVQESVWTGIMGLMAANAYGLDPKHIQKLIDNDLVRKGWQNHEAFNFPGLLALLRRTGASSKAVQRMAKGAYAAATSSSVGGAVPVRDAAHLGRIASYLPRGTPRDASAPIRRALGDVLARYGALTPQGQANNRLIQQMVDKGRLSRVGVALKLAAQYDAPTSFQGAQDRAQSSNTIDFINALKQVLIEAGVHPEHLSPAIHDVRGQARMSVIALGKYANPQAAMTGAAWAGLLGRQPGMLSFTRNPQGNDSIYTFTHPNADHVRMMLDQAGVASRTLVPEKASYRVYVYDKGRQKRQHIAGALAALGTQADEWIGTGAPVGGNIDDMGRSQYRDQINKAEAQPTQMNRIPLQMSKELHSWINSGGTIFPTNGKSHGDWAQQNGLEHVQNAWKNGWGRVYHAGGKLYVHQEGTPITPYQKSSLIDTALQNGLSHVVHDYGDDERVLWSDQDQLHRNGNSIRMMRHGNEEYGFKQAILSNPNDAAHRLVYADWLDEHGDDRSSTEAAGHRHVAGLMQQGIHPWEYISKQSHPRRNFRLPSLGRPQAVNPVQLAPTMLSWMMGHPELHRIVPYLQQGEVVDSRKGFDYPNEDTMRGAYADHSRMPGDPGVVSTDVFHGPELGNTPAVRIQTRANIPMPSFFFRVPPKSAQNISAILAGILNKRALTHAIKGQNYQFHDTMQQLHHANIVRAYFDRMRQSAAAEPQQFDRPSAQSMRPPLKLTLQDIVTEYKKRKKKPEKCHAD